MNRLFLKKEISLLHLLALLTGKLFLGISLGLLLSHLALPWTYPLLIFGALIFLPAFYYLFREEADAEKDLKKKLR